MQKCLLMILKSLSLVALTFVELGQAINSELTNLYSWLKANKLSLNIAKTEFMVVSSRQKFLAENCSEINQLDNQSWRIYLSTEFMLCDYIFYSHHFSD